ncbi:hypothetical protein NDU88_004229 [Pleurodeles waltl]|uniref:Uncharacterized protein n=1 Tax=Pleurodeles waltl TaxID=8319 RepID=A0AAV7QHS8_PLEWA|nr:hypothetical protein NDU88_004229 [Pleurodeles waltl]
MIFGGVRLVRSYLRPHTRGSASQWRWRQGEAEHVAQDAPGRLVAEIEAAARGKKRRGETKITGCAARGPNAARSRPRKAERPNSAGCPPLLDGSQDRRGRRRRRRGEAATAAPNELGQTVVELGVTAWDKENKSTQVDLRGASRYRSRLASGCGHRA